VKETYHSIEIKCPKCGSRKIIDESFHAVTFIQMAKCVDCGYKSDFYVFKHHSETTVDVED